MSAVIRTTRRNRVTLVAVALLVVALLAALALAAGSESAEGTAGAGPDEPVSPAAGACLENSMECDDIPGTPADGADEPSDSGALGMCAPGVTDCVDVVVAPHDASFDGDAATEGARALIGTAEADLDPAVRIARVGNEEYALTEDYVVGRVTVELDRDAEGTPRVTAAVVELPDGPVTVTE